MYRIEIVTSKKKILCLTQITTDHISSQFSMDLCSTTRDHNNVMIDSIYQLQK